MWHEAMGKWNRLSGRNKSGMKGTKSPSFPTLQFGPAISLDSCHLQADESSQEWSSVLQKGKFKRIKLALPALHILELLFIITMAYQHCLTPGFRNIPAAYNDCLVQDCFLLIS